MWVMLKPIGMPTGSSRNTGMSIWATLKPTLAMVVSISPRVSVHHFCETVARAGIMPDVISDFERFERFGGEDLARFQQTFREALLVVVAQEGRQRFDVRFEPVRPEILAHQVFGFVHVMRQPRQHVLEGCRNVKILIGNILR